jgi:glycosyltransferase involved in cell wall biosynthesis
MDVQLGVILPIPLSSMGVGYTCGLLAEGMADEDLAVTIITPRATRCPASSVRVIEVLPKWTRRLPFRWLQPWATRRIDRLFLSQMLGTQSGIAAAHVWPGVTTETILELKRGGVTVFREMINCHTGTAKAILDQAYQRLGVAPRHGITIETVQAENEELAAVDYIFCPSPLVKASVLENGVLTGKLLETSYGWDPVRLSGVNRLLPPSDGMTVVFVGDPIVRKGVHLLLDYWVQSGVTGRLVLAGRMEPIIREKCADLLTRDDIIILDIVRDVGALYRSADILALPTLEEGSPLVIYEACACGLPILTTPMGAGRIVRHNREGFIIDPYDRDHWIAAIRSLAEHIQLRRSMSQAAARRAQSFTWGRVGAQRRRLMMDVLANRSSTLTESAD